MSLTECGTIREHLPDFAAGRPGAGQSGAIEAHLPSCAECRAELDLLRILLAAPPTVPDHVPDAVMLAVRTSRRPDRRPWWGVSAAAVAAIALGIGVSADRPGTVTGPVPDFASEADEGAAWLSDDGLLAGAPSIDGLSDEALLELLEDLSRGGEA